MKEIKKFLSALSAIVIAVTGAMSVSAESSSSATDSTPSDYEYGDVDLNGMVDIFDAVTIAKYTVGKAEFDNVQSILADLDENGTVNIFDAIAVAKKTVTSPPFSWVYLVNAFTGYQVGELEMLLEKRGVDSSDFNNNSCVFYAFFEDAAAAESFDTSAIDGFDNNIRATAVKDNTLYFQFDENTENKTVINILKNLQNEDSVKELYPLMLITLE